MAQAINLQITPSNVMPKIYASQFDIGREIEIILYDGASAYTPPVGTDIRFEGKKPDGNGFSYACTYTGNVVTVVTTDQMTVLAGEIPCELRMSLNGNDIGTLNIIFVIEKSPIDENVPISDTEIPAIVELARDEQYTAEAWATGERNGVPVGPTDPQYHNNAKYWAEHAEYGALDDLTDVEITTPADGDLLQFNGADGEWVNTHDEISAIENVYGSKNLHRLTKVYVGNTGITWSMDENGVITLNGTASGNWTLFMTADASNWSYSAGTVGLLRKGTYKLVNKGANNKNDDTCFMGLVVKKSDGISAADIDTSSGVDVTNDFTIDGDNYSYISYIRITNGTNVNNVKFYPMIVDARIKDLTFASPAPTNRDCMSYAVNAKLGAHNLLRFPTLSELKALNTAGTWSNNVYTFGNATFTVNESAETVTVNCDGTGSAGLYFSLFNRLTKKYYLPNGTYKVNGLDNGEDSASYFAIEVSATTKNSTSQAWYVRGINTDGASFTYDDTQIDGLGVTISIMGNHTANNVVVKPMIRLASDTDTSHGLYTKTNMELTKNKTISSSTTSLLTYTTSSNYFTVPDDGYVTVAFNASGADVGQLRTIFSDGTNGMLIGALPNSQVITLAVKRGMKLYVNNVSSLYACLYRPLV